MPTVFDESRQQGAPAFLGWRADAARQLFDPRGERQHTPTPLEAPEDLRGTRTTHLDVHTPKGRRTRRRCRSRQDGELIEETQGHVRLELGGRSSAIEHLEDERHGRDGESTGLGRRRRQRPAGRRWWRRRSLSRHRSRGRHTPGAAGGAQGWLVLRCRSDQDSRRLHVYRTHGSRRRFHLGPNSSDGCHLAGHR